MISALSFLSAFGRMSWAGVDGSLTGLCFSLRAQSLLGREEELSVFDFFSRHNYFNGERLVPLLILLNDCRLHFCVIIHCIAHRAIRP
jgi:hypothetical protein